MGQLKFYLWVCGILLVCLTPLIGQTNHSDWRPSEFQLMESEVDELLAQEEILDNYSPEKFPAFKTLDPISRMTEQLNSINQKQTLLIAINDLIETRIFPFLISYAAQNESLIDVILEKTNEYAATGPRSMISIQEKINEAGLQIENLQSKIDRLQADQRSKTLQEEKKKKTANMLTMPVSTQIDLIQTEYESQILKKEEEEKSLALLKEKEKEKTKDIERRKNEITQYKQKLPDLVNIVEKKITGILIEVRSLRLNGLERPHLNTAKALVYIAENNIKTIDTQMQSLQTELTQLKKQRRRDITAKIQKAVISIGIALGFLFLVIRLIRWISKKMLHRLTKSEKLDAHHKQRYHTLTAVALSFGKIILWLVAIMWILSELNINYTPFLVAAGGLSLAIGFGAQSLVKDVVTGFFLLMEEQFALGDNIEIDGKTGTVEKISLRTIKFRDIDGTLHIIPNGNIARVSNKTYQWSRAYVKVRVSYDQKPEAVLTVLNTVCKEIFLDPKWKSLILEEPQAQGIIALEDSAIQFRILAKTIPGEQWAVERELYIRIKNTFTAYGIEIPYNYLNLVDRTPKSNSMP